MESNCLMHVWVCEGTGVRTAAACGLTSARCSPRLEGRLRVLIGGLLRETVLLAVVARMLGDGGSRCCGSSEGPEGTTWTETGRSAGARDAVSAGAAIAKIART